MTWIFFFFAVFPALFSLSPVSTTSLPSESKPHSSPPGFSPNLVPTFFPCSTSVPPTAATVQILPQLSVPNENMLDGKACTLLTSQFELFYQALVPMAVEQHPLELLGIHVLLKGMSTYKRRESAPCASIPTSFSSSVATFLTCLSVGVWV